MCAQSFPVSITSRKNLTKLTQIGYFMPVWPSNYYTTFCCGIMLLNEVKTESTL